MKQLIPHQFMFRFALRCLHRKSSTSSEPLGEAHRLAYPGEFDEFAQTADVRMAWNEGGLTVQWSIDGKREPLYGEADRPGACDGLTLWIDTRDTRTIHRATRHCSQFHLMAHTGDATGTPGIVQRPIHRALENAPMGDLKTATIKRMRFEDGEPAPEKPRSTTTSYWTQVFLPAAAMHGFEPEVCSRLGVCYRVRGRERGDQTLAARPEVPYGEEPSLWSVLELAPPGAK